MLLRELDRQARTEGGAVYMLNGNHESLNVAGDFRRDPSSLCAKGRALGRLQPWMLLTERGRHGIDEHATA